MKENNPPASEYIALLTGKDAKTAYAFSQQIAAESRKSNVWYSCFEQFAALPEIAEAKPEMVPRIRTALVQAELGGYPDSMQPLILKDIAAALQKMEGA